jgi:2-polyprenyl-3-methyl-5-hydroxy-6-metoxy-1,4-benzoquinol methylase
VSDPLPIGLELVEQRPAMYGSYARDDAIALLDPPLGRVLDVGCAGGANAPLLRERGATELVGIEIDEALAAEASRRYDEVVTASVEAELPWQKASFDTILCYDVLEHLYDPWSVLRRLRTLLRPEGRMQASIPNARNFRVWLPLVLEGRFHYEPAGLLDVTHIRFFSRRDAVELFERTGYHVAAVQYLPADRGKSRLAEILTRGRSAEFTAIHWYLLGVPAERRTAGAVAASRH